MSKLKKENGEFIADGETIEIPDFPLEFFPSTETMDESESEICVNDLQFKLSDEYWWNKILPICPKCKKVARWTNVGNTSIDMAILHSKLFDWALDHYNENKIRNADNVLVELQCGCKLTIKDKIIHIVNNKISDDTLNKLEYLQKEAKNIWNNIKASSEYKQLTVSENKVFQKVKEAFENVMGERLKDEYLNIKETSVNVDNVIKSVFVDTIEEFKIDGEHAINSMHNNPTYKGALIARGYCDEFADLLVTNLLNVISSERIKIYRWEYIHVFVVVDDEWILDPDMFIVKFSRQKLNEIFMHYVASPAVTLNEHYYIVAPNEQCVIYDPWDFIDNQDFNQDSHFLIPSIEYVYSVERYREMRIKEDEPNG